MQPANLAAAWRTGSAVRTDRIPAFALILFTSFAVCCVENQWENPGQTADQRLMETAAALTRQEQVLAAEISLAKSNAPYLSLDLANHTIDLKVRGRSLRSFHIARFRRTGGSAFVTQIWREIEAKPFQPAARARVVPGSGEATTAAIAAKDRWGPDRMPMDYDLICEDYRALEVRSLPSDNSRSRLMRGLVIGYRQARDWVRDLVGRQNAAYREYIEIWLSEDDARLLFWSLPKEVGILLIGNR